MENLKKSWNWRGQKSTNPGSGQHSSSRKDRWSKFDLETAYQWKSYPPKKGLSCTWSSNDADACSRRNEQVLPQPFLFLFGLSGPPRFKKFPFFLLCFSSFLLFCSLFFFFLLLLFLLPFHRLFLFFLYFLFRPFLLFFFLFLFFRFIQFIFFLFFTFYLLPPFPSLPSPPPFPHMLPLW